MNTNEKRRVPNIDVESLFNYLSSTQAISGQDNKPKTQQQDCAVPQQNLAENASPDGSDDPLKRHEKTLTFLKTKSDHFGYFGTVLSIDEKYLVLRRAGGDIITIVKDELLFVRAMTYSERQKFLDIQSRMQRGGFQ